MALHSRMNRKEIENFLLKGDMQDVMKYDVEPILHLDEEPGGYFGVPRQLFSLIDFLGAMYTGKYQRGKSGIGAIKYIKEIMGSDEIDSAYREKGKLMYEMYRHGLVHFFQPKMFKLTDGAEFRLENGTKIEWSVHKGNRTDDVSLKDDNKQVHLIKNAQHLGVEDHPLKDSKILIISLRCLFEDFKKSLSIYFDLIEKDKKYISKWNTVAGYITEYEEWPFKRKTLAQKLIKILKSILFFKKEGIVGI